jgi:hypothetical protein
MERHAAQCLAWYVPRAAKIDREWEPMYAVDSAGNKIDL